MNPLERIKQLEAEKADLIDRLSTAEVALSRYQNKTGGIGLFIDSLREQTAVEKARADKAEEKLRIILVVVRELETQIRMGITEKLHQINQTSR